MATPEELVSYRRDADIASIELRHAEKMNVFGDALVEGLHQALDKSESESVKHIVFQADGRGFSGGLDLGNVQTESDGDILMRLVRIEQLLQRVRHSPATTHALVHGACYGAAADLVLACRFRVATPDARFSMPGLRFGIVLGTRRLRDTIGEAAANKLLDRSSAFKSPEAYENGFLTDVAEKEEWQNVLKINVSSRAVFNTEALLRRDSRLIPDTRDKDMVALVESVVSSSIRERIVSYLAELKST